MYVLYYELIQTPLCFISELDAFDFSLYCMLTFMSCISLLLYLEQCVYFYKKLPSPKKTTIIWINGAAPVSIQARFVVIICC